ncbi:MAG TPA: prolipoprotein diacylglyceryl transferase family protein [Terracidiphilus sp.]|nr:prolipoprotein diacylglyceryl transferase family protein [Terracidiphilus sp.]
MLAQVHPILFHIGPVFIPSYGAFTALGVVLGLVLALRTARMAGVASGSLWNLCIVALFTALVGSRLLLVLVNWAVLRSHPSWLFGLAMVHHPLLAAVGSALALLAGLLYARHYAMPFFSTADALAPPLALGLACEQFGSLLAGSGFGTSARVGWAIVYTSPFAARWSGTPLGIPLHPVQAYSGVAFLTIALLLLVLLPGRAQRGDIAGLWLLLSGSAIYFTEFWRDPFGRGLVLHGALDGPQIAAIALVLLGGLVLLQRATPSAAPALEPASPEAPHA